MTHDGTRTLDPVSLPFWATTRKTLSGAWKLVRGGGASLFASMLIIFLLIYILVLPLIGWIFREAARASGMMVLDLHSLHLGGKVTITAVLLLVIVLIAFLAASAQLFVTASALLRVQAGLPAGGAQLWRSVGRAISRLGGRGSWPLLVYLLIMLPLSGAHFVSVVTQAVAIPAFITGELLKTPATATVIHVGTILLLFVNIRLSLSVPLFVSGTVTGGQAMRRSWKLTRGMNLLPLLGAATLILFFAALLTGLLVATAILPTYLADLAAPNISVTVAGISVAIAQVASLFLTTFITALLMAALITFMDQAAPQLRQRPDPQEIDRDKQPKISRRSKTFIAALALSGAVLLSVSWVPTMQQLSDHPKTLILAHRGFSDEGVENTINGLEAANAAGADLVEMDVMETKDGQFVVMHDANLDRLAGQNVNVKDLTLAELTEITVRDAHGHEDKIPSLEQYVTRAADLDQPLLLEIKMGGLDSDDMVDRMLEELEEIGVAERNIYHTLDYDSAERLKSLRPDLTVGYIMPIAGMGIPDTSADFLVIEQTSASSSLQQQAQRAGLGFFVWTVNDEVSQRIWLRHEADGLITDHPDLGLDSRIEMQDAQGMAGVLWDVLQSFVVLF